MPITVRTDVRLRSSTAVQSYGFTQTKLKTIPVPCSLFGSVRPLRRQGTAAVAEAGRARDGEASDVIGRGFCR